ncbi:MAG: cysteine desulfurase [Alphaproteobacteria bacterium]|nr:cysteine desulfurase [Alphaproteobacteria bacterium]
MSKPSIYLDYNATAPMRPSVRTAIYEAMEFPLNPSSVHRYGSEAKKRIEQARKTIADALSAFPNEIIFTASGTEANTLALRGFPDRVILTSNAEHASVAKTASLLGAATLPVDNKGLLSPAALDAMLTQLKRPALVSILMANNETGIIQPIRELADIAHHHGALLHADAVQAFGKIPLDMGLLGADMLTISAHKVGGPIGIAALVLRNDLPIKPLLLGGRQELGRRAGTESVALISGFATLATEVAQAPESANLETLRQTLELAVGHEYVVGSDVERLCNTSMLLMPHVPSETQLMHFDLSGFCVSAGSACSSGRIEPSHVLQAMGLSKEQASTAIRVSLGWANTTADIEAFSLCWKQLHERLSSNQRQSA